MPGRYYRRRFRARKKQGAKLNPKQKKEVKLLIGKKLETKEVKAAYSNQNITNSAIMPASGVATGFIFDGLSQLALGIGEGQYSGRIIQLKRMSMNLSFRSSAHGIITSADEYNNIRLIVFQWHPDSGIDYPQASEVLDTSAMSAGFEYLAHPNLEYKHKYTILVDRLFTLNNSPVWNGTTVKWEVGPGGTKVMKLSLTRKFNKKITITNTSNGLSKLNGIFLMCISDSTGSPNPTGNLAFESLYTDA